MKYYCNILQKKYNFLYNSGVFFVDHYFNSRSKQIEVRFINNQMLHNKKGAAFFSHTVRRYVINNIQYGDHTDFKSNKEWRRHIKLLAFI